jgi:hypothetical protein
MQCGKASIERNRVFSKRRFFVGNVKLSDKYDKNNNQALFFRNFETNKYRKAENELIVGVYTCFDEIL